MTKVGKLIAAVVLCVLFATSLPATAHADGSTATVSLSANVVLQCNVTTLPALPFDTDSATLWGIVTVQDGALPPSIGFVWDAQPHSNGDSYPNSIDGQRVDGTGLFYAHATGLSPGTIYYFRAFARSGEVAAYGCELSFKTLPQVTVKTLPAGGIKSTQAILYGEVTQVNVPGQVATSFGWDTISHAQDPGGYANWMSAGTASQGDTFDVKLAKLSPNTTYYFCASARTADYTAYGDEISFTTPPKKNASLLDWWDALWGGPS